MSKAEETITVFGVELPRWQTCERCGKEWACWFNGVLYLQPCDDCKNTPEWEAEQAVKEKEWEKYREGGIDEVFANQKPVAVHEVAGSYLYTNKRGDIIKEEKVRPMKQGEKWKK